MYLKTRNVLHTISLAAILVAMIIGNSIATATTYNYPTAGTGSLAVAPQSLSNGDTLNVNSGTMETPSTSSIIYTVDSSNATGSGTTVNVLNNATISYNGTNTAGAAIYSSITTSSNPTITDNININGAANSGTGLYAIYLSNANSSPNDTYNINVNSTGSVTGAILTSNINNVTLNLNSSNVTGTINLPVYSVSASLNTGYIDSNSTLNIGNNTATSFTPVDQIANIGGINIYSGSTFTLNVYNNNIFAIANNGTFNVNYQLNGVSTSDELIFNNGTMNISANIAKTGAFDSYQGTNVISGGTSSNPITISTSSYGYFISLTHIAELNNIDNYGTVYLPNSTLNAISSFEVTYPSNGYFPAGTYTLLNATHSVSITNLGSSPSSTLFLNFGPLTQVGNKVEIMLSRTPFNSYASTNITQQIGSILETIGSNSPNTDMVTILNALEQSTTAGQVEYGLQQLAPLTTAPIFGYQIQNDTMQQAKLRLAELRDRVNYFAGDIIDKDNHIWIRPFGAFANQNPIYDSLGYYATAGGIAGGFDRNLDTTYTLGLAAAYVDSHVNDKINPYSTTTIKSYIGMLYGTYNFSDLAHLDWVLAVTANNFNATRLVAFNDYVTTALSSYGSQQVAVSGLWSKDYEAFNFMQLTPLASAEYTFGKQYSYSETNANGANLYIDRDNSNIVQLGLGAKAAIPVLLNPAVMVPEIHALAFYCPIVGKQNTVFNFVEAGGTMTSIMNFSRTGLIYGAALTIAVVDKLEIKLNVDFAVEDRFSSHTVYLNFRYLL